MTRVMKIVQLGLEKDALALRGKGGLTDTEIVARLNAKLKRRGEERTVSTYAYNRWLGSLDKASVPTVHQPQVAQANVDLSIDVGERIRSTIARLDEYLPTAEGEVTFSGGKNWAAILGIIREAREQTKLYADLLERIYNAEEVARFQREVVTAIREADPETAERIRVALRRRHEIRRAALLGA